MDPYKSKYLKYKTKYFIEKQINQYNQTGGNLVEYADFEIKETQISSLSKNFLQDLILYSSKGSGSRSYIFAQPEGEDFKIIPSQDIEVTIRGIFYLQN